MGWAMREATPATVPLVTDLRPEETPAQPSLGRRVEKRELKTSEASRRSSSMSSWSSLGFPAVPVVGVGDLVVSLFLEELPRVSEEELIVSIVDLVGRWLLLIFLEFTAVVRLTLWPDLR